MKKKNRLQLNIAAIIYLLIFILSSCASSGKIKKSSLHSKKESGIAETDTLSPELRRKYNYFFLEAARLKEKGEYDAAFELYKHCLQINPNAAATLYEIAQFYLFLKQPGKGTECMEKAIQAAPDNYWYKQTLAAFHQSNMNFPDAIKVYEEMAKQFPARQEPLMALTDLYNRLKDYPNVIHSLDRLEATQGKSEQISMNKFRIYLMMGDDKKAFREIENLAKEYPNDLRYLTILGDVYLNNDKPQEAYNTYQKVLAEEPDNPMALLSMATYYEKTGQDDLYRQQLDTVLSKNSIDSNTKLEIMRQLIVRSEQSDKDSTQIISLFEGMMQQPMADAQIPMLYTQYLLSKNMQKESVPVLNRILQIDPENSAARLQLLSYALKDNNYEEVIHICESALEYSPETLEFYFYLGLAYMQANKKDESLKIFRKGISMVNEESNKLVVSDFYSIIGDLYHEKEMSNEAYAAYDSSLVYNPDNIGTLNNYAYYLSTERKNLDKAEEMSYKTVKAEPNNATYLDTYAWILFEKGKYSEAKIYMDDAMKNGGEESDVVVEHCGDIYYMNGEKEKAMEYWLKAKEMGVKSKTIDRKIKLKKYIAE